MSQAINGNDSQPLAYSNASLEYLKDLLDYDPVTGIFRWKKSPYGRKRPGQIAGFDRNGYIVIYSDGVSCRAHRLAWYIVHGEDTRVDHKDRNKKNNAISNLRKATHSQNMANQNARCTNELGVKGVQMKEGRYRAYITVNYKTMHLGMFDTIEEAKAAREQAAKHYFGEFANG